MTRLLLIILLFLSNSPAYAEWVEIAATDYGMTVYVDSDTIRRKGDLVKMWSLLDYKTLQTDPGGSYLSTKQQGEYDCAEERMRFHALTSFSGNMENGTVVYNLDETKWIPVAPESRGQALWKFACGEK
jgi:hypothetical protein